MLAASYWSLLAPAVEMTDQSGLYGPLTFLPVSLGFIAGALFVYLADLLLPILVWVLSGLWSTDITSPCDHLLASLDTCASFRLSPTIPPHISLHPLFPPLPCCPLHCRVSIHLTGLSLCRTLRKENHPGRNGGDRSPWVMQRKESRWRWSRRSRLGGVAYIIECHEIVFCL